MRPTRDHSARRARPRKVNVSEDEKIPNFFGSKSRKEKTTRPTHADVQARTQTRAPKARKQDAQDAVEGEQGIRTFFSARFALPTHIHTHTVAFFPFFVYIRHVPDTSRHSPPSTQPSCSSSSSPSSTSSGAGSASWSSYPPQIFSIQTTTGLKTRRDNRSGVARAKETLTRHKTPGLLNVIGQIRGTWDMSGDVPAGAPPLLRFS